MKSKEPCGFDASAGGGAVAPAHPESGECLICGAPLVYLTASEPMECAICRKTEHSRTRCAEGHYVCDECHMQGLDALVGACLNTESRNPAEIADQIMSLSFCHMHGPEHHVIVGAALLSAYKNAGGDIDLPVALHEMISRGRSVPGGACGFWGACGAGISAGICVSIISDASPLTTKPFGLSNKMTARALESIGDVGGPRCCKRDSYLSILAAAGFVREHFGIELETADIICRYSDKNNQCIGRRCPFSAGSAAAQEPESDAMPSGPAGRPAPL